jgi:hypothetical protein
MVDRKCYHLTEAKTSIDSEVKISDVMIGKSLVRVRNINL